MKILRSILALMVISTVFFSLARAAEGADKKAADACCACGPEKDEKGKVCGVDKDCCCTGKKADCEAGEKKADCEKAK